MNTQAAAAETGRLAENLLHFARVLRQAGLAVGTDRVLLAQRAVALAGLQRRDDLHAVLCATLLDRHAHRPLFDAAFAAFFDTARQPDASPGLPLPSPAAAAPPAQASGHPGAQPDAAPTLALAPALGWSERERLHKADFDSLSPDDWAQALRLLRRLPMQAPPLPSRRWQRATAPGRPDWRATLAQMGRSGGELLGWRWRRRREQPAPLVVLADISGSMQRYTQVLLHFAHALGQARPRVESFVFGTRLTRTTHALRQREPERALAQVAAAADDWSGGTRIADSLAAFNRHWARRVLQGRATVLLITDGLEQGDATALGQEMAALRARSRRLLWLNPLLRFEAFQPRAAGIRAMRPHCDAFLPVHNLDSLAALVRVLAQDGAPVRRTMRA